MEIPILIKEKKFTEIWNTSFILEKLFSKCLIAYETGSDNSKVCIQYMNNFEKVRNSYGECLIINKDISNPNKCDKYKKEYDICRDIAFKNIEEKVYEYKKSH